MTETYDYVIVGGGTVGCVLASRLTEDGSRSVLLVEAGQDLDWAGSPPEAFLDPLGRGVISPDYRWRYNGTLMSDSPREATVVRGRIIGGSGAINGSGFSRGAPEDYDGWGSNLWTFDECLPYFKRTETDWDIHDEYHGDSGPIPVRRLRPTDPLATSFFGAVTSLGFPECPDLNGADMGGIGVQARNIDNFRVSAALGYLLPARQRSNLTVWTSTEVLRIIFRGQQAVGLVAVRGRTEETVLASEVIVCASGLNSPWLLLQSGIGPASDLKAAGIPVVEDRPGVGQNLQDHAVVHVEFAVTKNQSALRQRPMPFYMFNVTTDGSASRYDVTLQAPRPDISCDWPEAGAVNYQDVLWAVPCYLQVETSRGAIVMKEINGGLQPEIHYNYLSEPQDLRSLRQAVRLAVEVLSRPEFGEFGLVRTNIQPTDLESDVALNRWLRNEIATVYHSTGTCRMGPASDPLSVVDERGSVHGVEGLRVIDVSIAPNVPRQPLNCTAFMIGERAAALLLCDGAEGGL